MNFKNNSVVVSEDEDIGNDFEYHVKIVFLVLMIVLGLLGNLLVFFALVINQSNPGNYFFLNLAIVDILISSISMPIILFHVVKFSNSKQLQTDELTSLCYFSAFLDAIILPVSWYSLAFTAVNLNCKISQPAYYKTYFKRRNVITIICLIWVWVLLLTIFNMVGWIIPSNKTINVTNPKNSTYNRQGYYPFYGNFGPPVIYDRASHICFLGIAQQEGRTFGTGFFSMVIPMFTIIFAYANMIVVVVKSRRIATSSFGEEQTKRRLQEEAKVFRMVVTMVIIFLLCWVPAIFFDYLAQDPITRKSPARLVFNWLALSYSVVKVVIYGAFSEKIRIGYKQTLYHLIAFPLYGCNTCVKLKERQRKLISLNRNKIESVNNSPQVQSRAGNISESSLTYQATPSTSSSRKISRKNNAMKALPSA